ncbi:hypothetical protein ACJX0J_035628, partial [Zea mays]
EFIVFLVITMKTHVHVLLFQAAYYLSIYMQQNIGIMQKDATKYRSLNKTRQPQVVNQNMFLSGYLPKDTL